MLRILLIIGLPYLAGCVTVVAVYVVRPAIDRAHTNPPPASPTPSESISRPLQRDLRPLKTWATSVDRLRSDRDIVDPPEHDIHRPAAGGSYIPVSWTPDARLTHPID